MICNMKQIAYTLHGFTFAQAILVNGSQYIFTADFQTFTEYIPSY